MWPDLAIRDIVAHPSVSCTFVGVMRDWPEPVVGITRKEMAAFYGQT